MKRLKLANDYNNLFNGNELKVEVIKYIFDNMKYDGLCEMNEEEKATSDYPGSPASFECTASGTITWDDIAKKFGDLSDNDKKQILAALNEDGGDAYDYVEEVLDNYIEGAKIETISYSFKTIHEAILLLDAKVDDYYVPTKEDYQEASYNRMDKRIMASECDDDNKDNKDNQNNNEKKYNTPDDSYYKDKKITKDHRDEDFW